MYVKIKNESDIHNEILDVLLLLGNISKSKNLNCYGNSSSNIFEGFSCSYRQKGLGGIIHGMIIDSCYQSERAGASSTKLCFDLIENFYKNNIDSKTLNKRVKKYCKKRELGFTIDSLKNSIAGITTSKLIKDMCIDAITLAGSDGMIEPEYTTTGVYSVEVSNGFSFPINAHQNFYKEGMFEWENVKLMAVDGTVDKESHVSGILTECSIQNQPIIILARGFGDEAMQTISGNMERGNIKCCPILIPYELEKINFLADVCGLIGADAISSLKGELISAAKLEDLKTFDKVRFFNNKTVFFSDNADTKVAIAQLVEKSENEVNDSVRDFLNERIRNLTSRRVALRIGANSKSNASFEISEVEKILRYVKDMKNSGEVSLGDLSKEFKELSFLSSSNEKLSCISVCAAIYHATSCIKMLKSLSCALIKED